MRFDLNDADWALLEPLLPKSRKSARIDDRKIVNAVFYVLRTVMPWRDLPARHGPRRLDTIASIVGPAEVSGSASSTSWLRNRAIVCI